MTVSLKHAFQSAKPDGADTSIVRPSDWNAEHVLTQASGKLLGRTSAGTGATEEITAGSGLALSAGTLTADVTSVAGRTGAVTLAVADVSGAAPTASPALTGTPTAPTAASGTNTTQIATTAYVQGEGYLKAATASATYLTISTASATYAPLASPTFTGTVTLPSTTAIGSVTSTELGYLAGVTSSLQTQINAKLSASATTYVQQSSATGAAYIPTGTTGDRPATPATGYFRYNTSLAQFEGYNGSAWGAIGGGGGGGGVSVTTSDTPPSSPTAGSLWWNSADGNLYIYYTDANSSQWVQANAFTGGSYLPLTGGSISGSFTYAGTLTGSTNIVNIGSGQFYKDSSGNIGIGTTSPTTKVEIKKTGPSSAGQANEILRLTNDYNASGDNEAQIRFDNGVGTQYWTIGAKVSGSGYLRFSGDGTERMRIDSAGSVRINSNVGIYNGAILEIRNSGGANQGPLGMVNSNSGTRTWTFGPDTNGNMVCMNTNSVGAYINFGSNGWSATSDERLKDITGEITDATAKVGQLRAVHYTWKQDVEKTPQVGLIAQDVQSVIPEAVSIGSDGYLGVRYDEVIPLLVAAIKELKAEITQLKGGV